MSGFKGILVALVIAGAIPLLVASYQFLLVAFHFRRLHYRYCAPFFPRTAVLIPAWNEGAVIGATLDRLMRLEYPRGSLRVFVIDDASTDETPGVVEAKVAQYPGAVHHLRREVGGQGKAHTLNHGLEQVLADDWAQAILITDSDVIFEPDALRLMTRHLADPQTGAVTAYIREGSRPGNYLTRFIGYEYITAQAAARRSQNVLGAMACLAGGAQLHSRANIEAVGGRIDTDSMAEDTVTTFETQLRGASVVFEPHAVVYAEEPGTIAGLWKQRLRWGRGNIQVTRRFWPVWFQPAPGHRLGGVSFAAFWFTLLVQPFLMICGSASLITLYFLDRSLAWHAFHGLWILNLVAYVFITSFALLIDSQTARHVWRQAILFPGLISLVIMLAAVLPGPMRYLAFHGLSAVHASGLRHYGAQLELFSYVWLAASMGFAYLAKVTETRLGGRFLSPLLVYLVGYGPLLCAVTLGAYVQEIRHADASWQKTEKTGKMAVST